MTRIYVEGIAFWAPRLPGWSIAGPVLAGTQPLPEQSVGRPAPALLPPNERRRAPDTVAVAMVVASEACAAAGRDPGKLASVFTSTHGDLAITDYMSETLASAPESVSPTKFHNSVHNAAAGYWSIATGCMAPYTAVSAWKRSFAAGLVECITQVCCDEAPVLLVAYDIEAKGALAEVSASEGVLAGALLLSPTPSANCLATIDWSIDEVNGSSDSLPTTEAAERLSGNAMASCLSLFGALAGQSARTVVYSIGPALALNLFVQPQSAIKGT